MYPQLKGILNQGELEEHLSEEEEKTNTNIIRWVNFEVYQEVRAVMLALENCEEMGNWKIVKKFVQNKNLRRYISVSM